MKPGLYRPFGAGIILLIGAAGKTLTQRIMHIRVLLSWPGLLERGLGRLLDHLGTFVNALPGGPRGPTDSPAKKERLKNVSPRPRAGGRASGGKDFLIFYLKGVSGGVAQAPPLECVWRKAIDYTNPPGKLQQDSKIELIPPI